MDITKLQLRVHPLQFATGRFMWSIVEMNDPYWTPQEGPPMRLSTQEMLDQMGTPSGHDGPWVPVPGACDGNTLELGFAPSIREASIDGAARLEALCQ